MKSHKAVDGLQSLGIKTGPKKSTMHWKKTLECYCQQYVSESYSMQCSTADWFASQDSHVEYSDFRNVFNLTEIKSRQVQK